MPKPEGVEEILARLMPAALSETATLRMEETLDELAARAFPKAAGNQGAFGKRMVAGGIAALLVVGATLFLLREIPEEKPLVSSANPGEIVLLHTSERVEEMSDEGWQGQQDGTTMHTVRVSLMSEKEVRDRETGIVMRISQPREEWILTPIHSF